MKFNSKSRTRKILFATWAIPVVMASPYTFSNSYPFVISSHMGSISRQICNDRFDEIDALMYGPEVIGSFRRGYFIFLFLVIYVLPMVVILATCVRIALCLLQPIAVRRWPSATGKDTGRRHEENKRKVARMVIVVAVAFIVAWSPFYLCTLVSQIQSFSGDSFLRERNFVFTMLMIHLCGFLNSCINPLIYTGMSKKFRRSFKMILSGCICCRLTYRFLRYRNSLNRGASAGFTSTLCQSMTEVHDANDLALSEAGSSSGAERSLYHVRANPHSPASHTNTHNNNNNNSFRQHHQNHHHRHLQQQHQQQRSQRGSNRPGHQYNVCGGGGGVGGECSPDPSSLPLTLLPEMTSLQSRGYQLWGCREEKKPTGVTIQLMPLDSGSRRQKVSLKEGKTDGLELGKVPDCSEKELGPGKEKRRSFNDEWQQEPWPDRKWTKTGTVVNSKSEGTLKMEQPSSDPVHSSGLPQTLSSARGLIAKTPEDGTFNGNCFLKHDKNYRYSTGCKLIYQEGSLTENHDVEQFSLKEVGDWGVVTVNSKPCLGNKDRGQDWHKNTAQCLPKEKQSSAERLQNQKNAKVSNCLPSQHQHGAVVHVVYAKNSQCVQL